MKIQKDPGFGGLASLQQSEKKLGNLYEKLAKGKRITRASDDAAGLAIARELEKQVRGFRQADHSLSDGLSVLRIADGGSDSITQMLQRQRELALQASNGTLNDDQRQALNTEFQALREEIDRTAKSTQFNGQQLLDGTSPLSDGSGELNAGSGGGESDRIAFAETDLSSESLGLNNLDISTSQGASQALSEVNNAMRSTLESRTQNGALYNRMEHSQANAKNQEIQSAAAQSQLEDLDMAVALSDRVREELLSMSGNQMLENYHQIARNNMMALLQ